MASKKTAKKTTAKKPSEKELLQAEATKLGVQFKSKTSIKDLKEAIEKAKAAPVAPTAPASAPASPDAPAPEAPAVNEASPASDSEVKDDAELSKDHSSIKATGKFEVVEVAKGKFRMFNERGNAVSGIVTKDDVLDNGKKAYGKMIRDSRRSNALRKQREIATPKGHEELN